MPAFQAINLEPEENIDEQVDTSKELHVDEALKRFQTTLKLHAQGPRAREAAGAAYRELFDSEIFGYREAKTDYERAERQADGRPELSALESFSAGLDMDAGGADGVAASLSQAFYLSYKNFGQFHVDKLKDAAGSDPQWRTKARIRYHDEARVVLDNWTAALDQDPSDPELWRKAARVAGAMNSGRIKRYCLEAAVELDDDPAVMEVEPPSISEGLAGEQLKGHLRVLGDELSLSHPIMAPWLNKDVSDLMKRHLDPLPFLPDPSATLTPPPEPAADASLPEKEDWQKSDDETCREAITSWRSLGLELIMCKHDDSGCLRACRSVLKAAQQDTAMGGQGNGEEKGTNGAETTAGTEESNGAEPDSKAQPETKEQPALDAADDAAKASEQPQKDGEGPMSTRKRSQSVAGLADGADEDNAAEKRSKRVRRRTEAKDAEEMADPSTLMANQMQPYQDADLNLFRITKKIVESLGVGDRDTLDCLQEVVDSCTAEDRASKMTRLGAKDLRSVLAAFNEDTAMVLLNKKEQATLGLSSFLEHAKSGSQDRPELPAFDESSGLRRFAEKMCERGGWMTNDDIAFEWVRAMSQSYADLQWSDMMKVVVVQMLHHSDAVLYERITGTLELVADSRAQSLGDLETMIPMLLELHIDIYERITNPSSAVDYATRMETKYRLGRWLDVASTYVQLVDRRHSDRLCVRFMWAAAMASSLADKPVREHILLLWTSLRDLLSAEGVGQINLPNNVVMPTISAAAAEREISKLTTMDFFLGLFQEEMEDPVHVIETLEPVLNPSSVHVSGDGPGPWPEQRRGQPMTECASQGMRDMWKFLSSSSTELRLFLWSRLGDAYAAIDYPTKRFSCLLKSIEMMVGNVEGEAYGKTADESRRVLLMRTMKSLDELLIQALTMGLNDGGALEIVDEEHMRSSAGALARLSCLLHVAAVFEDKARTGAARAAWSNGSFTGLVHKLREMQVRTWSLQYTLFKAGLGQQERVPGRGSELAGFLAAVHRATGLRRFCKASNKIFLKMTRMELLGWSEVDGWEEHLGQVLYDLHGLKLGAGAGEVQEHGCPADKLERRQAMQLVDKVMALARRMAVKDLLKSELKTTMEHVQQAVGQTKSTPQMIHNLRNFTEMLKKPVHPLRLYQAFCGDLAVDAVGVGTPEAALARHGWFFLHGIMALTKFKGVDLNRRQTPEATDNLRIGATFLRLQLQFTPDDWQAWFRLAECFDYELDEAVLWTADKMNKDRAELVKLQRNAIHCYTLALSHSRRADDAEADADALHDLYHKFALRLYSSSREPFAMEPFQHSDQERFFIEAMGSSTFRRILHDQMSAYKVCKYAAKLFRMAMARPAAGWKDAYMLAKCYWKMYQTPPARLDVTDRRAPVTADLVLRALRWAVEAATHARRSRTGEPVFEPYYKMVSVLHKLVSRGDMAPADAAAVLSDQPLAVAVDPTAHYASFSKPEDWEEYVIGNLASLRDRDKSNWQHRIVMRHARILFDDDAGAAREGDDDGPAAHAHAPAAHASPGHGLVEARAAFAILKENMFTKTMVMNVWKCDTERPGRHHVFTEQYVRFMTRLLVVMADRANLELLLRRLRKKSADFYHFADLWQSCCIAYLRLLRAAHAVGPASDDAFKTLSTDEFEIMAGRVAEWAAGDGPPVAALSCMKDAVELKKLNANLMKATAIDDLVYDCYAAIYVAVADQLPGLEPSRVIAERNHARDVAAELEAAAAGSLSSILNPDSAASAPTPLDADRSEAAPRARRAVRRADVLRKAEQAILRAAEAPKAAAAAAKSRVGSVSSKRGSHTPAAAASDADDSDDSGSGAQVRHEAAAKDDSEPGSIHDSADDESDLSDVPEGYDEDIPPGLMFPNLGRPTPSEGADAADAGPGARGSGDSEADDDDTDMADAGECGAAPPAAA